MSARPGPAGAGEPGIVVVGASWGGLEAMEQLLDHLPRSFSCPMVLVQHRSPKPSQLAGLLARHTAWAVREADDKTAITPATLHIAPPGYHLLVEPGRLALSVDGPLRHSRPSIDVAFESAADAYAEGAVGVVLTGANADGAAGLAAIAERGGRAFVQDPDEAIQATMPRAAIAAVPDAAIGTIAEIAEHLCALCRLGAS